MATPCTPSHVRFKSDLTLVDGLCTEATVLKVDEDRFFELSALNNLLGFHADHFVARVRSKRLILTTQRN